MKKRLCLLLVVFLLMPSLLSQAEMMPMASNYFLTKNASLSNVGGGTISIRFNVVGVELSAQLGVSTYSVQRYVNGSWSTVSSGLTGNIAYNTVSNTFTKTYNGTAGQTYRITCTFVCENSYGYVAQGYTSGSIVASD